MAGQPEKRYVDRGDLLQGVNRVVRDYRVPLSFARNIENYRLPDQKLIRRPGFSRFDIGARVHGQQLSKTMNMRRVQQVNHKSEENPGTVVPLYECPNSYALLKWHDDYQIKSTRDHTVEFLYTMGEEPFTSDLVTPRRASGVFETGSTYNAIDPRIKTKGVLLYDQSVIAARCEIRYGAAGTTGILPKNGENRYARQRLSNVCIPALAISITKTEVELFFATLRDNDSATFDIYSVRNVQYLTKSILWSEGVTLHIAVRYTASTKKIELVVDGDTTPPSYTLEQTPITAEHFAGEKDSINEHNDAIQRDIVLLNECTVRGYYSSTGYRSALSVPTAFAPAMILQNCFADDGGTPSGANGNMSPLHLSPPRGSGMANLRIWHEARSAVNLDTNAYIEIAAPLPANLKGDWPLNDGGGICLDRKTARRYITLHNTFPQYVDDAGLLHSKGIHVRDNQYLHHRIEEITNVREGVLEDASILFAEVFRSRRSFTDETVLGAKEPESDWTFQMQIRTPYTWQQELGKAVGLTDTAANRESTGSMGAALEDGSQPPTPTPTGRRKIQRASDISGPTITWKDQFVYQAHRQMLFSIEGSAKWEETLPTGHPGYELALPVPLVQCWIDSSGFVHLEVYLRHHLDASGTKEVRPTKHHYKSNAALTLDTVHNLTLVKRARDSAGNTALEIWIDGTKSVGAVSDDTSRDTSATFGVTDTSPIEHIAPYDICIGAAEVRSNADMRHANSQSFTVERKEQGKGSLTNCPGDFTLGYFRMWARALTGDEISASQSISLDAKDTPTDLLINLEIDQITGAQVANKSRYSLLFDLGFSSYFQASACDSNGDGSSSETVYYAPYSSWAQRDCLGYRPFPSAKTTADDNKQGAECKMLAPYNSTLAQQSGIAAIFANFLLLDRGVAGAFVPLPIPSRGLLAEFSTKTPWDWALIGDRLIMTSLGALPKVFDGRTFSTLGFPEWDGFKSLDYGTVLYAQADSLDSDKWYGVILVYVSERANIQHISPRMISGLDSGSGDGAIQIRNILAHPDPRVSAIHVYRTASQDTRDLASKAPVQLMPDLILPNHPIVSIYVKGADSTLAPVVLDITKTPAPVCAYCEAFEGYLVLVGDALVADAVYFSDPGNPEVFDVGNNVRVLEEGSGDRMTGLASVFGGLLVFKANSVWRLDFAGPGQLLAEPLNKSIGALAHRSVRVFVNPDTGQTLAFFWSRHGPYLMDGSAFSYIGFPIESEDTGGANTTPYDWLDPQSVSTLVVPEDSEIICFYKETGKDRLARAAVFNWRNKSWSFNTGQIGVVGEAFNLSSGIDSYTYLSLLGDRNGRIWKWGGSYLDGITTPIEDSVQSYSSPTITVQGGGMAVNELVGLWVTVIREDYSDYFILPILTNTATTITLDTGYGAVGFTPQKNDKLLLGLPPALVEYPWDVLDLPFFDKKLTRLVTWHDKRLWHRFSRNWDMGTPSPWREMRDAEKQRKLTPMNFEGEAIKLSLLSFMRDSRIDGYGYDVAVFGEGKMPQ